MTVKGKIGRRRFITRAAGHTRAALPNGDFRELLARDDIDVVVISTPDHWHAITVIQSAETGTDIYREKLLSQTIAEARGTCRFDY